MAAVEVRRVARHIARAEQIAGRRDLTGLSRLQRILRALLLEALAAYRGAGRFPKNRDFAAMTPYFVDASGTRCAMAHLLELGGEQALVAKIARERNNAYVRELADEPGLLAWLAAAGITVEEAAAIQPGYCSIMSACVCGDEAFSPVDYPVPAAGVLEGVVQANGMVLVDHTYGDTFGIAAGAEIALRNTFAIGTRVLAPIDSAETASLGAIALGDGVFACSSQAVTNAPPLTADEFAQAVLASDCPGTLRAMDSEWGRDSCTGGDTIDDIDDGGCSAAGDPSIGILLAVVAALVKVRAR